MKLIGMLLVPVIVAGCGAAIALTRSHVTELPPKLLTKPPPKSPGNDPVQVLDTGSHSSSGEIVYLLNTLPPGPPRPITYALVFRQIGGGVPASRPSSTVKITAPYASLLLGCSLSPNGQYVLLKQGMPQGDFGPYRIVIWGRKAGHLDPGPGAAINYQKIVWSPASTSIAYTQASTPDGRGERGDKPVSLRVWNLKTHKDQLIINNPEEGGFAWTRRGTLLFTFKPKDAKTLETPNLEHPSVYESSATGGRATQIIRDAYSPQPSPDGRFIAFLGWSDAARRATQTQEVFGLYLFEWETGARRLIHALRPEEAPDTVLWSQNSKTLYSIQNVYNNTHPPFVTGHDPDYPGSGQGRICALDVATLKQTAVATLSATDAMARPDPESQFAFKGASADGRFLSVLANELRDDGPTVGYLRVIHTLYSVDPRLHSACPLWTTDKTEGIDWRGTAPALAGVKKQKSSQ